MECGINVPSLDLLIKISNALEIESYELFQTAHLKDRKIILKEIKTILSRQSDENIRLFYKILTDIAD